MFQKTSIAAVATMALGLGGCGKQEAPESITPGDFNLNRASFVDKHVTMEGTARIDYSPVVRDLNGRAATYSTMRVSSVSPLEGDGVDLLIFEHMDTNPVNGEIQGQPPSGVVQVSGEVKEMADGSLTLAGLRVRAKE